MESLKLGINIEKIVNLGKNLIGSGRIGHF